MACGLKELLSFLMMQSSDAKDVEMIGMWQSIQQKHIAPLMALTIQGKRERGDQRNLRDTEIYEKMMPVEVLKGHIKQSYEDLLACEYALTHPDEVVKANWIKAAAVCVAGPNFVGKQAGRGGEWDLVKRAEVQTPYPTSSVPSL